MMTRGRTLRAETKHYVPKLLAAALIGKHPERFGFRVAPEGPFEYDEAEIAEPTSLSAIATAANTTVDRLRELNPALRRFCTPPTAFTLRLPKGSKESFTENYLKLDEAGRLAATQHLVEKGDSLGKLARAYGVSEQAILKSNGLAKPNQVKVGKMLSIPLKASRGLAAGETLEDRRKNGKPAGRTVREPGKGRAITATPSSNYAQVARAREAALAAGKKDPAEEADARAAKAAAEEAARKQRLATARKLAGALLGQRAPASAGLRGGRYVVQPGDSLWSIATKLGIPVDVLQRKNGLSKQQVKALRVGQALEVDG
jgi:membrane-bound lytic murein transglycosylase D